MPFLRSPDGRIGSVPDFDYDRAVAAGFKPVTDEEVAAAKATAPENNESLGDKAAAFGEGAVKGAVNAFTAPLRAGGALAEAITGEPNQFSEALRGANGENALAALKTIGNDIQGKGPGLGEESERATADYMRQAHARAEANPISAGAGELAGGALGLAPGLGLGAGGAATTTAGKLASAGLEGAGIGGTQAIAQASDEARDRNSTLTGINAIVAGGLGALLGGGLSLAGKAAGEWLSSRSSAAAKRDMIPDLEMTGEPPPLKGGPFGEGGVMPEVPDLDTRLAANADGPQTIPAPPLPKEAELAAQQEALRSTGGEGRGMGFRSPSPPNAPETATLPAPPTTNAELMGGKIPAPPGLPQDLENAHIANRGPEQELIDMRRGLNAESAHMNNRAAVVSRLLDVIPPETHPDWVLGMSPKQRIDLADFVGAEASDETWGALADALAKREGLPSGNFIAPEPARGAIPDSVLGRTKPMPGPLLPPPMPEPAAPGNFPGVGAPFARGTAEPVPMAGYGPPTQGTFPETGAPFKPSFGTPNPDAATIGESISAAPTTESGVGSAAAKKEWSGFLSRIGGYVTRYGARHAIGSVVGGGPFGAAAYAGGLAVSELMARARGGDAMGRLASRSTTYAESALKSALSYGSKLPSSTYAVPGAIKSFMSGAKTPEAAFDKRMAELQNLSANNGQVMIDKVADAFGPLAHTEQPAILAVTQAAQRGVDYLLQTAPKTKPDDQSLTPITDSTKPARADINEWARVYSAVMHPMTVLQDIRTGVVVADQIQAVKTVYPTFYEQQIVDPLNSMLRERDMKKQPLLPQERRVADIVLGSHSGTDNNDFVLKYGPLFDQALSSGPGGQSTAPKQTGRKLKGSSSIAASTQTQTSTMLGNIK